MSAADDDSFVPAAMPFRVGRGPQVIGVRRKATPVLAKSGTLAVPKALKLPPLTSGRNLRRGYARLCTWVLEGRLDSVIASRLAFIMGGILKALEAEQLSRPKPGSPAEDYDLARLNIEEQRALHSLLTKASLVAEDDAQPAADVTHAALPKPSP